MSSLRQINAQTSSHLSRICRTFIEPTTNLRRMWTSETEQQYWPKPYLGMGVGCRAINILSVLTYMESHRDPSYQMCAGSLSSLCQICGIFVQFPSYVCRICRIFVESSSDLCRIFVESSSNVCRIFVKYVNSSSKRKQLLNT